MDSIIVVEGLHDEINIKNVYPNAKCVITNGSAVNDETIKIILIAFGVIVFGWLAIIILNKKNKI